VQRVASGVAHVFVLLVHLACTIPAEPGSTRDCAQASGSEGAARASLAGQLGVLGADSWLPESSGQNPRNFGDSHALSDD
jgi:hypothetical protein